MSKIVVNKIIAENLEDFPANEHLGEFETRKASRIVRYWEKVFNKIQNNKSDLIPKLYMTISDETVESYLIGFLSNLRLFYRNFGMLKQPDGSVIDISQCVSYAVQIFIQVMLYNDDNFKCIGTNKKDFLKNFRGCTDGMYFEANLYTNEILPKVYDYLNNDEEYTKAHGKIPESNLKKMNTLNLVDESVLAEIRFGTIDGIDLDDPKVKDGLLNNLK